MRLGLIQLVSIAIFSKAVGSIEKTMHSSVSFQEKNAGVLAGSNIRWYGASRVSSVSSFYLLPCFSKDSANATASSAELPPVNWANSCILDRRSSKILILITVRISGTWE